VEAQARDLFELLFGGDAGEAGGAEVVEMRRAEADLPEAVEGLVEAGAVEEVGGAEEEALAVGDIDHEDAAGVEEGVAGVEDVAGVGDVFENVVEGDDVEAVGGGGVGKGVGEIALEDIFGGSAWWGGGADAVDDCGIRFETHGVEPMGLGEVEEEA